MPVEQILELAAALVNALGPLVMKLFAAAASGGDVGGVLARERVEDILGETSRLELAEHAARLREARAAGHLTKLAPADRVLIDSVLAMHAELAKLAPSAESAR